MHFLTLHTYIIIYYRSVSSSKLSAGSNKVGGYKSAEFVNSDNDSDEPKPHGVCGYYVLCVCSVIIVSLQVLVVADQRLERMVWSVYPVKDPVKKLS